MAHRSRVQRNTSSQASTSQAGIDLSLLQTPMELSITGALQVARCLSGGTPELQELLTEECDIIFECRVCRNLFRNLPNFIAHKRHYCKENYCDTRLHFIQPKPEHETLLVQPSEPKRKVTRVTEKAPKVVENGDIDHSDTEVIGNKHKESNEKDPPTREIVTEGSSDTFKFYTKLAEKLDARAEAMKRCIVELEDVQGNRHAKRQKVIISPEEKDIKAAAKKHSPSHADIAIITQSFDSEEANPISSMDEGRPRKISLRQRGGSGEVKTPIAEKLAKRKDCDIKTQTCLKCNSTYSSLKILHFHMVNVHSERRTFYPCVYAKCKATFSQMAAATKHLQRAHGCTKNQIEKLRAHLKKFAYTRPVDELERNETPRRAPPLDLVAIRANKRKRAEEHKEKVEKTKKEATDTVNNVTKRLSEKMKKTKATWINFGSGFTLFKCQNCSKAFAKEDSLNRHKAFCFGLGAIGSETGNFSVATSRSQSKTQKPVNIKPQKPALVTSDKNDEVTPSGISSDSVEKKEPRTNEKESMKAEVPEMGKCTDDIVKAAMKAPETVAPASSQGALTDEEKLNDHDYSNGNEQAMSYSTTYLNNQDKEDVFAQDDFAETSSQDSRAKKEVQKGEVDKDIIQTHRWATDLTEKEIEKIRKLINEQELQCLKCDRKYGNISNLHRHAFRHLGWKRFRCTLCEFTGYNRSECKTHLIRVHLEKSDSNPDKFILDLEPEKMKVGVSARSRVESKRQSSLRVLQKMQELRRQQQSSEKAFSPAQRLSPGSSFNISTRNSPRAFDISPYKRVEQEPDQYSKSDGAVNPTSSEESEVAITDQEDEGNTFSQALSSVKDSGNGLQEDKKCSDDKEMTVKNVSDDNCLKAGQEYVENKVPRTDRNVFADIVPHIVNNGVNSIINQTETENADKNDAETDGRSTCVTESEVAEEEHNELPNEVEPTANLNEESVHLVQELADIGNPVPDLEGNREAEPQEIIFVVMGADGEQSVAMTTDATEVTETIEAMDTTEEIKMDASEQNIYVINNDLTDIVATEGSDLTLPVTENGVVGDVILGERTEKVIENLEDTTEVVPEIVRGVEDSITPPDLTEGVTEVVGSFEDCTPAEVHESGEVINEVHESGEVVNEVHESGDVVNDIVSDYGEVVSADICEPSNIITELTAGNGVAIPQDIVTAETENVAEEPEVVTEEFSAAEPTREVTLEVSEQLFSLSN